MSMRTLWATCILLLSTGPLAAQTLLPDADGDNAPPASDLVLESDDAEEVTPSRMIRSTADTRRRRADELDRPRNFERETRHGFEVKSDRYSVIASSGRDDAVSVHREFGMAWEKASALIDPVTRDHRRADFAIGAVTVMVDNQPQQDRNAPDKTMNYHGPQTLIHLDVSEEDLRDPAEVTGAIHAAAMQAILHHAGLDAKLPGWIRDGLSGYVAEQAIAAATASGSDKPLTPAFDVETWKRGRVEQDRLADEEPRDDDATSKVRFFLEAEDARYAVLFFEAVRETMEASDIETQVEHRNVGRRTPPMFDDAPSDEEIAATPVDALCEELQGRFAKWRADPHFDQPIREGKSQTADIAAAEDEMLVVLKFIRRLNDTGTSRGGIKVTGFNSDGKRTIETPRRAERFLSLENLYLQATDASSPQALLAADGSLVHPENEERYRETLGLDERLYSATWNQTHWTLSRSLDDGRTLRGGLEPNPDDPRRPFAKFKVVDRRVREKVTRTR